MDPAELRRQASSWDVGCRISLGTTFGEDIKGEVMGFDSVSGVLTLRQSGSTPFHSDVRLLRTAFIQSISATPPDVEPNAKLPYIDVQRCQEREARAIMAAEMEAAKVGVDVSPEAQKIFDGLAKTMPCQWRGHTIVVLDEVSITPPYDGSSCSQISPNAKLFDRVLKVLAAERARLGLKK